MGKAILCLAAILLAGYFSDASTDTKSNASSRSTRFGQLNMYYLFDRDNARTAMRIEPTAASLVTLRNMRQKTTVIIHDHEGSATRDLNPILKDALLSNEDVSVLVVDWSIVAGGTYENAASNVGEVGAGVANLLSMMIARNQINLARLHLVGFGIGAHIAASAARALATATTKVARITGLNPAGPGFTGFDSLREDAATYVEVIHTDDVLGIGSGRGHMDFFVNGGTSQLGCGAPPPTETDPPVTDNACNHRRSWEIFAASVTHPILNGNQCSGSEATQSACKGFAVPVGNNELTKYGTGIFYLETSDTYPYFLPPCTRSCAT